MIIKYFKIIEIYKESSIISNCASCKIKGGIYEKIYYLGWNFNHFLGTA
jgi:hypothetical protein